MTESEINEVVARRLGWIQKDPPEQHLWKRPGEDYYRLLWDFCHCIDAAWEIVEHVHRSTKNRLELGFGDDRKYRAWFYHDAESGLAQKFDDNLAETAPMAIALCFLKMP